MHLGTSRARRFLLSFDHPAGRDLIQFVLATTFVALVTIFTAGHLVAMIGTTFDGIQATLAADI